MWKQVEITTKVIDVLLWKQVEITTKVIDVYFLWKQVEKVSIQENKRNPGQKQKYKSYYGDSLGYTIINFSQGQT